MRASGNPRVVTSYLAPHAWNLTAYSHWAEEGEVEWTKKGWDMYWEIDRERYLESLPPNPKVVEMEIMEGLPELIPSGDH